MRFLLLRGLMIVLGLTLLPNAGLPQNLLVRDIGLRSGFQDIALNHHMRGRAIVAADFDLDGYVDFYMVDEHQSAGLRTATWNGTNQTGQAVASGYYFLHMNVGTTTAVRKMLFTK